MWDEGYYEKRRKTMAGYLDALAKMGYRFEQFNLQHRDVYLKYEPETEVSCRSLLSQYAYAQEDCIHIWEDQENECLFVIFLNTTNELRAYPPIMREYSPERFSAAIDTFIRIFSVTGASVVFKYADEEDIKRFKQLTRPVEVKDMLRNKDYIYEFESLKDFSGKQNTNRRRKHNHFLNNHQVRLKRYEESDEADCVAVLSQWCAAHSCEECGHRCPRDVTMRALHTPEAYERMAYLMYVDETPQAFILLGRMSPDMLDVLTVCSGLREMGLEETLYVLVAEAVSPPYKYMNLEEDMDIERLRLHKQSMHPCRMQSKYSVSFSKDV